MGFANKDRRRFEPHRAQRFTMPRIPPGSLLRAMLLAALGIVGAGWALVNHYTARHPPMLVPVQPAPTPTYDADAGEMPVPEIERAP